jgi:hypothetical protein
MEDEFSNLFAIRFLAFREAKLSILSAISFMVILSSADINTSIDVIACERS